LTAASGRRLLIAMCNLYRVTTNVEALTALVRTFNRPNLPPLAEVYPNREAPIIRPTSQGHELLMMAWGVPLPQKPSRPDKPAPKPKPVTNVRNLSSPFWRSMLTNPERRCLVPVNSFSEWTDTPDPVTGKKRVVWFGLMDVELFTFAGIWRPTEQGARFAFLTTEANALVQPVHAKAMPVILRPGDYEQWLSGDFAAACALAKPYTADDMQIVS